MRARYSPRFVATRACGLVGLLWLYSLQAAQESPPSAEAPVEVLLPTPAAPPKKSMAPSVMDFGATGDGVTDDTAAILKAVNSGLQPLHFPLGTYRLTRTIEIHLDKSGPLAVSGDGLARLKMDGPGPALRISGNHHGTADPKTISASVGNKERFPTIDGIEIIGHHSDAGGIELHGTMQATLTRVVIRGVNHAVRLTGRNRNVLLGECHLYDNRGVGVYMDGVNLHQINIGNCHISYNRQGGVVCRDSEIRNLHINGCDLEANVGDGPLAANVLVDCSRGSVREGVISGCTLQHERDPNGAANIRFIGASKENPLMVGMFVIADNILSDVKTNIHLKHARGVVIEGNNFFEGYDHNLLAENCSNLIIGPNLFDRNPDQRDSTSKSGIELRDCWDCSLNGLHLNGVQAVSAALLLDRCAWCNITNCFVADSGESPIELLNCVSCRISGCMIRVPKESGLSRKIRITGGSKNVVADDSN